MWKSPTTATQGRRKWRNSRESSRGGWLQQIPPTTSKISVQECRAAEMLRRTFKLPWHLIEGWSLKEELTKQGKMEQAEQAGEAAISHLEIKTFGILKTNILSLHSNLKSCLP